MLLDVGNTQESPEFERTRAPDVDLLNSETPGAGNPSGERKASGVTAAVQPL